MKKTFLLSIVMLFAVSATFVSCSSDDDPIFVKDGTLTLEMPINVTDVEAARRLADELHLNVIEEGQLPFWDNGVKYFTSLGPNQEKIEFNQYL